MNTTNNARTIATILAPELAPALRSYRALPGLSIRTKNGLLDLAEAIETGDAETIEEGLIEAAEKFSRLVSADSEDDTTRLAGRIARLPIRALKYLRTIPEEAPPACGRSIVALIEQAIRAEREAQQGRDE